MLLKHYLSAFSLVLCFASSVVWALTPKELPTDNHFKKGLDFLYQHGKPKLITSEDTGYGISCLKVFDETKIAVGSSGGDPCSIWNFNQESKELDSRFEEIKHSVSEPFWSIYKDCNKLLFIANEAQVDSSLTNELGLQFDTSICRIVAFPNRTHTLGIMKGSRDLVFGMENEYKKVCFYKDTENDKEVQERLARNTNNPKKALSEDDKDEQKTVLELFNQRSQVNFLQPTIDGKIFALTHHTLHEFSIDLQGQITITRKVNFIKQLPYSCRIKDCVQLTTDCLVLIIGNDTYNQLYTFNFQTQELLPTITESIGGVMSKMALAPNGYILINNEIKHTCLIIDPWARKLVCTWSTTHLTEDSGVEDFLLEPTAVDVLPDGKIVIGDFGGCIRIWEFQMQ